MSGQLRNSGIPPVGDIAWGTHICHFFETMEDLCDTVVPYFIAGHEGGELCFWLLADLTPEQCLEALRSRARFDVDREIANGSIVLQEATEWYRREGVLDAFTLRGSWAKLLADSVERGFAGVRIAGCQLWLAKSEWAAFSRYEADFQAAVADQPMIVLCSYPLATTGAAEVLDVARTHDFALAKRDGQWEMVETPAVRVRQLDVRSRQQAALARLGLMAIRGKDIDALLAEAASLSAETLGTGRGIAWQFRPEQNDLILRASTGWDELPPNATIPYVEGTPAHYGFTHDTPVVVIDVPNHPHFFDLSWLLRDYSVATLLSAVIRGREAPWGALSVHSMTRREFNDDDTEFLQSMANVLCLAIERNEHEFAERREKVMAESALARLRAIESITDAALGHLGLDELLAVLLPRVRRALQVDYATVTLLDDRGAHLVVRAVDGYPPERLVGSIVPAASPVSMRILRDGKPRIIDDVLADSGPEWRTWTATLDVHLRSSMGVPLPVEGRTIGVLSASSSTERRFTEDDLELLSVVATRVAPAIERGRLMETIRAARERLASLSRRLLSVQEEERRRLAIELHDELGQILTAVKINLGSTPAQLDDALETVDRAMQTVRDLALDLRPAMLDDLGLAAALRWYADRFAQQARVQTHLAIGEVPHLDSSIATACFRVAQEALTNVLRHAGAANVSIELTRAPAELTLSVRDDGAGFDVASARERAARGASLGLIGMEERASLAGGSLEIRSAPGQGTDVRARFPLGGAR
jgi:signal transduction histidine kinase